MIQTFRLIFLAKSPLTNVDQGLLVFVCGVPPANLGHYFNSNINHSVYYFLNQLNKECC